MSTEIEIERLDKVGIIRDNLAQVFGLPASVGIVD